MSHATVELASVPVQQPRGLVPFTRRLATSVAPAELHAFAHDAHRRESRALVESTLDHPDSTLSSARLALRSHTAVSRLARQCWLFGLHSLLPAAQIQAGTLFARFTSLRQTRYTAHAVAIPAVREEVVHLHFWHVTI